MILAVSLQTTASPRLLLDPSDGMVSSRQFGGGSKGGTTVVEAGTTAAEVDTTAIEVDATSMETDATAIDEEATAIEADATAMELNTTAVEVHLIALEMQTTVAAMDATAAEVKATAAEAESTAVQCKIVVVSRHQTPCRCGPANLWTGLPLVFLVATFEQKAATVLDAHGIFATKGSAVVLYLAALYGLADLLWSEIESKIVNEAATEVVHVVSTVVVGFLDVGQCNILEL